MVSLYKEKQTNQQKRNGRERPRTAASHEVFASKV